MKPAAARAPALALAAAAGVPLAAYVWALHPGLAAGDSGELVTAAATGGVAHPPGYPLYVLLGGLWLRLCSHASPAWAMNLFSAVCAAAAAGVLAAAVKRACGSWPAGVLAGWLLAACPPCFTNAIVAEVFALHALLAACALLALVSAPAAGAVALAFLSALALSHHHTLVLLTVPAFVACAWNAFREAASRARLLAGIAGAALAGLLPLLWLPTAAAHAGALVWGEPSTLRGFVSILLRAEYGTFRLDPAAAGHAASGAQLVAFARALPEELTWPALSLAGIGAWRLWAGRPPAALALLAYAALQAWFFTRAGFPAGVPWLTGVVERFHILPLLVGAFLAGLGAAWAVTRLARGEPARRLAFGALLALAFASGAVRARALEQRGNQLVETLGRGILASVPPRGVVFTRGDVLHNALAYLQLVEHERPDVVAVDQELLAYPWYVRQVRARHPGLLPPLDRAERITLAGGRVVEGVAIARAGGTADLLTESVQRTVPADSIAGVQRAPAATLYPATHAGFRRAPWLDAGEDRYSGLPGSRNLLWFDALGDSLPACVLGSKDDSYALRYGLVPHGLVQLVRPRGEPLDERAVLDASLAAIDAADPTVYFHVYAPTSLERPELPRFSSLVADAALLLAKAGGGEPSRARDRVRGFARRFEALEPTPDATCLRAIGFLRVLDPGFRDAAAARSDLERALAASPDGAGDHDAHRVLAMLGRAPR